MEICHVCKKEKKPYTVFLTDSLLSIIEHYTAREDGPICERCDKYHAMTGEFKDATEKEFEIAKKAAWFTMMMSRWWKKDKELVVIDDKDNPILTDVEKTEKENSRGWGGKEDIAKWCRAELTPKIKKQEGDK